MDWASNLFVGLFLTDCTGMIFFLVSILFRRLADKDAVFLRFLTKATMCAYLLPFVYIVLYMTNVNRFDANAVNLFYSTPAIMKICAALGLIWAGLFLVLLVYKLYRRYLWTKICRGNIPEEDERIAAIFNETCARLGIKEGKVALCRNDSVHVPCITYYHGYVVILPLVRYTEKQAGVIFYHELCHYLNGDLHLKTAGCIIALLHVFNPLVHILMRQTDLLCERCCDRAACDRGAGSFTPKEYFQIILRSLVSEYKADRYQLFALSDDKTNYERRVEYMLGYHRNGGLRRKTALILAACFLCGSSLTALAAGDGMTGAYQGLADDSSFRTTDNRYDVGVYDALDADAKVLPEFSEAYDLDPAKVTMVPEPIDPCTKIKEVSWTVPAGETVVSWGFVQHAGDEVLIVVTTGTDEDDEDDIEYQMGIKDPDAIMRYVEGTGRLDHTFKIDKNGTHYFFVTNVDETRDIHIHAYIFRD